MSRIQDEGQPARLSAAIGVLRSLSYADRSTIDDRGDVNQRKPNTRSGGGRSRHSSKPPRSAAPALQPSTTPAEIIESFDHWNLGKPVLDTIAGMGIVKPTPIQALAIGPVLEGRDVIAKAETGTGKTLAFGAPMLARIDPSRKSVLGLVLCPTRELSEQVYKVLAELGRVREVRVALIVGGEDMRPQVDALKGGAQLVVGTPGRVLDLMRQGFLSFPWTEYVVLDEADKMLEIGFLPDVEKILAATPEERQTLLFSATFPNELLALARRSTREPAEIATASGMATVDTISQYYLEVGDEDRVRTLARLIEGSGEKDVFLVFCDRRTDVDRLMRRMETLRFSVKSLHGGYDQAARFRVMTAFRTGEVKALIATDVASRGLDVEHVTHVVNFGAPRDASDYTHRIGRTGRAGRTGVAVTLVPPAARGRWRSILQALPWDVEELEDVRSLAAGNAGKSGKPTGARPPKAPPEPEPSDQQAQVEPEPRQQRARAEPEHRQQRARAGSEPRQQRARAEPESRQPRARAEPESRQPRARAEPESRQPRARAEPEPRQQRARAEPEPRQPRARAEPEPRQQRARAEPEARQPRDRAEPEPRQQKARVEPEVRQPRARAEPEHRQQKARAEPEPRHQRARAEPDPQQQRGRAEPDPREQRARTESKPRSQPAPARRESSREKPARSNVQPEREAVRESPRPAHGRSAQVSKGGFGEGVGEAAERPAGRRRSPQRKGEDEPARPERAPEPKRRGRLDFGSGV